ncbi:hypothetical protein EMIT0324P_220009 [Pseudomonas chlororaphis]
MRTAVLKYLFLYSVTSTNLNQLFSHRLIVHQADKTLIHGSYAANHLAVLAIKSSQVKSKVSFWVIPTREATNLYTKHECCAPISDTIRYS